MHGKLLRFMNFKIKLFFFFVICLIFLSSCTDNESIIITNDDFVSIKDSRFYVKDEFFSPIMLNYVVDYRCINDSFVVSPAKYYENANEYECNSIEGTKRQLSSHFCLIRDLGFNTVRICIDRFYSDDEGRYSYSTKEGRDFFIENDCNAILDGLQSLVDAATENNLRVMLLLKPCIDNRQLEKFNIAILKRFSSNPTVFAYDFMNEPLYFDRNIDGSNIMRDKEDAYRIVSSWKKLMSEYAPNQLLTIGFGGPLETLEWDPALLPVDFVQVHSYHPLYFKNEIWWYSHFVEKNWMIGETALPADNDSISYAEQSRYLTESFEYVADCGGSGYGWWEFQEMPDNHFEAQFGGLMTHSGYELNSKGDTVIGTLKPAAKEISNLLTYQPKNAVRAVNYYNMIGYNNLVITGRIVDQDTKQPVEGAIIRGWNRNWSVGTNTYSDENGNFTLFTNDLFVHFEISAPKMSKVKFDKEIEYHQIDNSKEYRLDSLPAQDLEYHRVAYHTFLKDPDSRKNADESFSVFDYDPAKFDKAKFSGSMGDIFLKKLICK